MVSEELETLLEEVPLECEDEGWLAEEVAWLEEEASEEDWPCSQAVKDRITLQASENSIPFFMLSLYRVFFFAKNEL